MTMTQPGTITAMTSRVTGQAGGVQGIRGRNRQRQEQLQVATALLIGGVGDRSIHAAEKMMNSTSTTGQDKDVEDSTQRDSDYNQCPKHTQNVVSNT